MSLKVLSIEDLIEKLEKRNLKFKDKNAAKKILNNLTYFKLKEFSYVYLDKVKHFKDNVYFEMLVDHFYLDKKLRFLSLSLIELIEIAIKTRLIRLLGREDSYEYINFSFAKNSEKEKIKNLKSQFLRKSDKILKEDDDFNLKVFKNFKIKDNLKPVVPIWILMELISLGELVEILNILTNENLNKISYDFKVTIDMFLNDMRQIKELRNMSAHNNDILGHKFEDTRYGDSVFSIILIIVEYIYNIGLDYDLKEIEKLLLEAGNKTEFLKEEELKKLLKILKEK